MSRYIDADKLQKDGWKLRREKHGLLTSTYETMELDCVPTADVVEVVRCKDCKYYTLKPQQTSRVTSVRRCNRSAIVCTKPDDFCSFGERIAK